MPSILLDRIPDDYDTRSFSDDLRMDADLGTFTGHASAFGYVDSFGTTFDKRAFNKTLADKEGRIPVLFFHEPKEMVGPARTLKPDRVGLYHESKAIEDGRTGSYVLAHMRGGTPMGMSFGFKTKKVRAAEDADDIRMETAPEGMTREDVQVITELELYEISVLPWVFASQPKADITNVRSVANANALSTITNALRSGALSHDAANALAQEVAAYSERAGAGTDHSTPEKARHDISRDVALALALAQFKGLIPSGVPLCLPS